MAAAGGGTDALEGKGPQRRPERRFDMRLEEVAQAVGGGYCRLQMPLKLALGVRETVAGHRLGALGGKRGGRASNARRDSGRFAPRVPLAFGWVPGLLLAIHCNLSRSLVNANRRRLTAHVPRPVAQRTGTD